jgi:hypothetical protein
VQGVKGTARTKEIPRIVVSEEEYKIIKQNYPGVKLGTIIREALLKKEIKLIEKTK